MFRDNLPCCPTSDDRVLRHVLPCYETGCIVFWNKTYRVLRQVSCRLVNDSGGLRGRNSLTYRTKERWKDVVA